MSSRICGSSNSGTTLPISGLLVNVSFNYEGITFKFHKENFMFDGDDNPMRG